MTSWGGGEFYYREFWEPKEKRLKVSSFDVTLYEILEILQNSDNAIIWNILR